MFPHGRQGEIARLMMEHRTALYGFVYSCVRNHHEAEDVLQEVSVAVIESAEELGDAEGFLPWAREIARRRTLAHLRARSRERSCDPELVERLAEASGRVERAEPAPRAREALMECLEELPVTLKEVVGMRYGSAVSSAAEAAERIGRSVQAVYSMLKRARQALRVCVERRLAQESRT
jgi:RNA polymerase sigma-70 factor (ECF subfamily)